MKEIVKYANCFVCGDKNDTGIKARFFFDGQQAICEVVAAENLEGYAGIYHGGIIATLLDEVMIKAILAGDHIAVTAEITVRYHKPVKVGQKLKFIGRIRKNRGRVFLTEGEVRGEDGRIVASASGKYVEAKAELKKILVRSIDRQ